jgi:hypothetical protein
VEELLQRLLALRCAGTSCQPHGMDPALL